MKSMGRLYAAGACVALLAACGGANDGRMDERARVGDQDLVQPRMVTVEGCLTSSNDRFVLTELKQGEAAPDVPSPGVSGGAPQPVTESYRLVGLDEELEPLVWQRVTISGQAEPEQVVDVRQSSPPFEPGNQPVGTSGSNAQISTVEATRVVISDLRVRSVEGSGETCGQNADAPAR